MTRGGKGKKGFPTNSFTAFGTKYGGNNIFKRFTLNGNNIAR